MTQVRVFSFGGGVQSVALLALAARGAVNYDAYVFANVGNDSESPATLDYLENYVKPFCEDHELRFVEVQKTYKGQPDTILQSIERDNRSVTIPAYMATGAPGNRSCTFDYKVKIVDKWIKTLEGIDSATIGVGISTDESKRMRSTEPQTHYSKTKPIGFTKTIEYPLIKLGLSRSACIREIEAAGLPIPLKSSCWFCPFHSPATWIEMKRNEPELFNKAVEVEKRINEKRELIGKDRLSLHSRGGSLDVAVADQMSMFDSDCGVSCDSGYCHT